MGQVVDYIALIERYYADNEPLRQLLMMHSRQVADRALDIVSRHPDWVQTGKVNPRFVEEAAMLHDIGIIFCNAPKIYCHGTHQYIEHGYLGAELLRREDLPLHAAVAERHTGSGLTAEQILRDDIPIPVQDYFPITLEEKIICYADKFFSKTHPGQETSMAKVRENIWRFGHDAVLRFDAMQALMET